MEGEEPAPRRFTPTLLFIALAFAVPWAGWISLAIFDVRRPWLVQTLFFTGDFCSVAGLIATYYAGGRQAVIGLLGRTVSLRAPIVFWLYALCLPILWQACSRALYGGWHGGIGHVELTALARFWSAPMLFLFLTGPLGEELGWRGFLLPRLLRKNSALQASVILGIMWGLWHLPLYYKTWEATPWKAPNFLVGVICFSVLLALLYIGTRGNLLLCIVMHWMFNAAQQVGKGMFPDVKAEGLSYKMVELAVLAVITVIAAGVLRVSGSNMHAVGPEHLNGAVE
jgi:membrane protease YdiL (CAAX protease family)